MSLATLFETPTVAGLAERLRGGRPTAWSPLVAIKPEGTKPPLFLVHAAGGHVLFYRDLARHLDPEQPVFGLQARGLDKTQTHHDRVEAMAAYYLMAMRVHQPAGPYYVGGSSFGGLVAFEIAQQLRAQGEDVGLVALMDTTGRGTRR